MKQSTAVSHLRTMMLAIQKLRSINDENGTIEMDDPIAASVWPWVYDSKKSILPILSKLLDRVDETNELSPLDYYNFMTVATHLEPLIGVVASIVGNDPHYPQEPDINWLKGWDKE